MVLIFIGVAGSAFDTDVKADLAQGESIHIRSYDVTLAGIRDGTTANYAWYATELEVEKDGKLIGTFDPQKHTYFASGQPTSEVRRYATFTEDLYLVFAAITEEGKATVQVFVKPLVRWVWLGGIVMFLGTVVTMVPNKRQLKAVKKPGARKTSVKRGKEKYEVA